jgi:uncharacterized membrane protein (Fun14 family)
LSSDVISSISAIVGGGFFGGLLFGYAIKKVVKLIAVIAGLFLAGLAYLQYQQIASFNWNKIEVLASTALGNITTQISNSEEGAAFAMSNLGIPSEVPLENSRTTIVFYISFLNFES